MRTLSSTFTTMLFLLDCNSEPLSLVQCAEALSKFEDGLKTDRSLPMCRRASNAFSMLVQMEVETTDTCDCNPNDREWLHHKHRLYNRAVWELLVAYELLEAVKNVCLTDVDGPDRPKCPGFGTYVKKTYGRELLAYFLRHDPSPDWVSHRH